MWVAQASARRHGRIYGRPHQQVGWLAAVRRCTLVGEWLSANEKLGVPYPR